MTAWVAAPELRFPEVAGPQWQDVDYRNQCIHVSNWKVCGSSPHGPTILFNTLESFLRNPRETSPVILHL